MTTSLLEIAIQIAAAAHAGQKQKNGQPYILHPLRVMMRVHTEDEKIVAILHDVLEDTPWTAEQLQQRGFPLHILRALEESNWNVSGAARALGMERTNLHKRIRALGLSRGN